MKTYLYLFSLFCLFNFSLLNQSVQAVGLEPALSLKSQANLADWTIMVYISGDNDLEEYVVKDLEQELAKIGSNQRVRVVALADRIAGDDTSRGDWTQTLLYHVTPGLKATAEAAVADWGDRNMGDPATLAEFVSWSRQNYPAQRYALFFWGHGWNWHPGYVMEDVSNQAALDVDKIKAIQPQLGFLDLVAFDGCNMGSIEVETLWQGHTTALVHSQEFVDWDRIIIQAWTLPV